MIKNVLKNILSNLEKREKEEGDFLGTWEKIVGKETAKHAKPAFLKAKRLVVNVSDSSRLYKLTLEKQKLIEKINKNLTGKKKIKELQFRIGDV